MADVLDILIQILAVIGCLALTAIANVIERSALLQHAKEEEKPNFGKIRFDFKKKKYQVSE